MSDVTPSQIETAMAFVRMAKQRPMDSARKRQFAIVRVQSALKVPPLTAASIVDEAFRRVDGDVTGNEAAIAEQVDAATEPQAVDSTTAALMESNALLEQSASAQEALREENSKLREELDALKSAPPVEAAPPAAAEAPVDQTPATPTDAPAS